MSGMAFINPNIILLIKQIETAKNSPNIRNVSDVENDLAVKNTTSLDIGVSIVTKE